jgi:hypothetical protein
LSQQAIVTQLLQEIQSTINVSPFMLHLER